MKNALVITLCFSTLFTGCAPDPSKSAQRLPDIENNVNTSKTKKNTEKRETGITSAFIKNTPTAPDNTNKSNHKQKAQAQEPETDGDQRNDNQGITIKKNSNHIMNSISLFFKEGKTIRIEDLHENTIYQIPKSKIETFHLLLSQQDQEHLNTEKKLLHWIDSQFPINFALVIFTPHLLAIEESLKESINQKVAVFIIEINKDSNTLTFSSLSNGNIAMQRQWFVESDTLKTSENIKEFLTDSANHLIDTVIELDFIWYSALPERNDGTLFNGMLSSDDSEKVLHAWTRGKKIKNLALMDFSYLSNKTSYQAQHKLCLSADYLANQPFIESNKTPENHIIDLLDRINQSNNTSLITHFYFDEINKKNLENTILYDCYKTKTFYRYLTHYIKPYKAQSDRENLTELEDNQIIYDYINAENLEEKNSLLKHLNEILKINSNDENTHTTMP